MFRKKGQTGYRQSVKFLYESISIKTFSVNTCTPSLILYNPQYTMKQLCLIIKNERDVEKLSSV